MEGGGKGKSSKQKKDMKFLLRLGPSGAKTQFGEVAGSLLVASDQFFLGDVVLVLEQWVL
jgi:hypothetical protein